MKSMLIIASFIAVAVASPTQRGLVAPGMPGPTPVVEPTPIAVGPAIIDNFEQVPSVPVYPVIDIAAADGTPLVQIIINVNDLAATEIIAPAPVESPIVPEVIIPGPVNVVDNIVAEIEPVVIGTPVAPGPVNVVDNIVTEIEPVIIGSPVAPGPVNVVDNVVAEIEPVVIGTPVAPGPVNVVDNVVAEIEPVVIGTPVVVEPVVVGTPIIPAPAVVLPEILN